MRALASLSPSSIVDTNELDDNRAGLVSKLTSLLDFGRAFQDELRTQQQSTQAAAADFDRWRSHSSNHGGLPSSNSQTQHQSNQSNQHAKNINLDAIAGLNNFPTAFSLRASRQLRLDRVLKPVPDSVPWFPTDAMLQSQRVAMLAANDIGSCRRIVVHFLSEYLHALPVLKLRLCSRWSSLTSRFSTLLTGSTNNPDISVAGDNNLTLRRLGKRFALCIRVIDKEYVDIKARVDRLCPEGLIDDGEASPLASIHESLLSSFTGFAPAFHVAQGSVPGAVGMTKKGTLGASTMNASYIPSTSGSSPLPPLSTGSSDKPLENDKDNITSGITLPESGLRIGGLPGGGVSPLVGGSLLSGADVLGLSQTDLHALFDFGGIPTTMNQGNQQTMPYTKASLYDGYPNINTGYDASSGIYNGGLGYGGLDINSTMSSDPSGPSSIVRTSNPKLRLKVARNFTPEDIELYLRWKMSQSNSSLSMQRFLLKLKWMTIASSTEITRYAFELRAHPLGHLDLLNQRDRARDILLQSDNSSTSSSALAMYNNALRACRTGASDVVGQLGGIGGPNGVYIDDILAAYDGSGPQAPVDGHEYRSSGLGRRHLKLGSIPTNALPIGIGRYTRVHTQIPLLLTTIEQVIKDIQRVPVFKLNTPIDHEQGHHLLQQVLELFPTLYTTQSRRSYFGATAGFTKPDISLQSSKTNGSFAGAGAANLAAAFGVPGSATGFSAFGFSDPTDSGRPSLRRAVWAPYLRFGPVRRDSACVVDVERLARLNRIDALLAMEFAFITSTDLTAVLKRIHYLSITFGARVATHLLIDTTSLSRLEADIAAINNGGIGAVASQFFASGSSLSSSTSSSSSSLPSTPDELLKKSASLHSLASLSDRPVDRSLTDATGFALSAEDALAIEKEGYNTTSALSNNGGLYSKDTKLSGDGSNLTHLTRTAKALLEGAEVDARGVLKQAVSNLPHSSTSPAADYSRISASCKAQAEVEDDPEYRDMSSLFAAGSIDLTSDINHRSKISTTDDNEIDEARSSAMDEQVKSILAQLPPPHRIHTVLALRHLRLRSLRLKIRSLLNFFRSIEKRLTIDSYGFAMEDQFQFHSEHAVRTVPTVPRSPLSGLASNHEDGSTGDSHASLRTDEWTGDTTGTPVGPDGGVLHTRTKQHRATKPTQNLGLGFSIDGTGVDSQQSAAVEDVLEDDHRYHKENRPERAQVHDAEYAPTHYERDEDTFMKFTGVEARDDTYVWVNERGGEEIPDGEAEIEVLDPCGNPIIYDAALQDMAALEDHLLRLGTFYIQWQRRHAYYHPSSDYEAALHEWLLYSRDSSGLAAMHDGLSSSHASMSLSGDYVHRTSTHSLLHGLDITNAFNNKSNMFNTTFSPSNKPNQQYSTPYSSSPWVGATNNPSHGRGVDLVDRGWVLLDLFESEYLFQLAKAKRLHVYLQVYDHCIIPSELQQLAQRMYEVMQSRPSFDIPANLDVQIDSSSFAGTSPAYASQTTGMQAVAASHAIPGSIPREPPNGNNPQDRSLRRDSQISSPSSSGHMESEGGGQPKPFANATSTTTRQRNTKDISSRWGNDESMYYSSPLYPTSARAAPTHAYRRYFTHYYAATIEAWENRTSLLQESVNYQIRLERQNTKVMSTLEEDWRTFAHTLPTPPSESGEAHHNDLVLRAIIETATDNVPTPSTSTITSPRRVSNNLSSPIPSSPQHRRGLSLSGLDSTRANYHQKVSVRDAGGDDSGSDIDSNTTSPVIPSSTSINSGTPTITNRRNPRHSRIPSLSTLPRHSELSDPSISSDGGHSRVASPSHFGRNTDLTSTQDPRAIDTLLTSLKRLPANTGISPFASLPETLGGLGEWMEFTKRTRIPTSHLLLSNSPDLNFPGLSPKHERNQIKTGSISSDEPNISRLRKNRNRSTLSISPLFRRIDDPLIDGDAVSVTPMEVFGLLDIFPSVTAVLHIDLMLDILVQSVRQKLLSSESVAMYSASRNNILAETIRTSPTASSSRRSYSSTTKASMNSRGKPDHRSPPSSASSRQTPLSTFHSETIISSYGSIEHDQQYIHIPSYGSPHLFGYLGGGGIGGDGVGSIAWDALCVERSVVRQARMQFRQHSSEDWLAKLRTLSPLPDNCELNGKLADAVKTATNLCEKTASQQLHLQTDKYGKIDQAINTISSSLDNNLESGLPTPSSTISAISLGPTAQLSSTLPSPTLAHPSPTGLLSYAATNEVTTTIMSTLHVRFITSLVTSPILLRPSAAMDAINAMKFMAVSALQGLYLAGPTTNFLPTLSTLPSSTRHSSTDINSHTNLLTSPQALLAIASLLRDGSVLPQQVLKALSTATQGTVTSTSFIDAFGSVLGDPSHLTAGAPALPPTTKLTSRLTTPILMKALKNRKVMSSRVRDLMGIKSNEEIWADVNACLYTAAVAVEAASFEGSSNKRGADSLPTSTDISKSNVPWKYRPSFVSHGADRNQFPDSLTSRTLANAYPSPEETTRRLLAGQPLPQPGQVNPNALSGLSTNVFIQDINPNQLIAPSPSSDLRVYRRGSWMDRLAIGAGIVEAISLRDSLLLQLTERLILEDIYRVQAATIGLPANIPTTLPSWHVPLLWRTKVNLNSLSTPSIASPPTTSRNSVKPMSSQLPTGNHLHGQLAKGIGAESVRQTDTTHDPQQSPQSESTSTRFIFTTSSPSSSLHLHSPSIDGILSNSATSSASLLLSQESISNLSIPISNMQRQQLTMTLLLLQCGYKTNSLVFAPSSRPRRRRRRPSDRIGVDNDRDGILLSDSDVSKITNSSARSRSQSDDDSSFLGVPSPTFSQASSDEGSQYGGDMFSTLVSSSNSHPSFQPLLPQGPILPSSLLPVELTVPFFLGVCEIEEHLPLSLKQLSQIDDILRLDALRPFIHSPSPDDTNERHQYYYAVDNLERKVEPHSNIYFVDGGGIPLMTDINLSNRTNVLERSQRSRSSYNNNINNNTIKLGTGSDVSTISTTSAFINDSLHSTLIDQIPSSRQHDISTSTNDHPDTSNDKPGPTIDDDDRINTNKSLLISNLSNDQDSGLYLQLWGSAMRTVLACETSLVHQLGVAVKFHHSLKSIPSVPNVSGNNETLDSTTTFSSSITTGGRARTMKRSRGKALKDVVGSTSKSSDQIGSTWDATNINYPLGVLTPNECQFLTGLSPTSIPSTLPIASIRDMLLPVPMKAMPHGTHANIDGDTLSALPSTTRTATSSPSSPFISSSLCLPPLLISLRRSSPQITPGLFAPRFIPLPSTSGVVGLNPLWILPRKAWPMYRQSTRGRNGGYDDDNGGDDDGDTTMTDGIGMFIATPSSCAASQVHARHHFSHLLPFAAPHAHYSRLIGLLKKNVANQQPVLGLSNNGSLSHDTRNHHGSHEGEHSTSYQYINTNHLSSVHTPTTHIDGSCIAQYELSEGRTSGKVGCLSRETFVFLPIMKLSAVVQARIDLLSNLLQAPPTPNDTAAILAREGVLSQRTSQGPGQGHKQNNNVISPTPTGSTLNPPSSLTSITEPYTDVTSSLPPIHVDVVSATRLDVDVPVHHSHNLPVSELPSFRTITRPVPPSSSYLLPRRQPSHHRSSSASSALSAMELHRAHGDVQGVQVANTNPDPSYISASKGKELKMTNISETRPKVSLYSFPSPVPPDSYHVASRRPPLPTSVINSVISVVYPYMRPDSLLLPGGVRLQMRSFVMGHLTRSIHNLIPYVYIQEALKVTNKLRFLHYYSLGAYSPFIDAVAHNPLANLDTTMATSIDTSINTDERQSRVIRGRRLSSKTPDHGNMSGGRSRPDGSFSVILSESDDDLTIKPLRTGFPKTSTLSSQCTDEADGISSPENDIISIHGDESVESDLVSDLDEDDLDSEINVPNSHSPQDDYDGNLHDQAAAIARNAAHRQVLLREALYIHVNNDDPSSATGAYISLTPPILSSMKGNGHEYRRTAGVGPQKNDLAALPSELRSFFHALMLLPPLTRSGGISPESLNTASKDSLSEALDSKDSLKKKGDGSSPEQSLEGDQSKGQMFDLSTIRLSSEVETDALASMQWIWCLPRPAAILSLLNDSRWAAIAPEKLKLDLQARWLLLDIALLTQTFVALSNLDAFSDPPLAPSTVGHIQAFSLMGQQAKRRYHRKRTPNERSAKSRLQRQPTSPHHSSSNSPLSLSIESRGSGTSSPGHRVHSSSRSPSPAERRHSPHETIRRLGEDADSDSVSTTALQYRRQAVMSRREKHALATIPWGLVMAEPPASMMYGLMTFNDTNARTLSALLIKNLPTPPPVIHSQLQSQRIGVYQGLDAANLPAGGLQLPISSSLRNKPTKLSRHQDTSPTVSTALKDRAATEVTSPSLRSLVRSGASWLGSEMNSSLDNSVQGSSSLGGGQQPSSQQLRENQAYMARGGPLAIVAGNLPGQSTASLVSLVALLASRRKSLSSILQFFVKSHLETAIYNSPSPHTPSTISTPNSHDLLDPESSLSNLAQGTDTQNITAKALPVSSSRQNLRTEDELPAVGPWKKISASTPTFALQFQKTMEAQGSQTDRQVSPPFVRLPVRSSCTPYQPSFGIPNQGNSLVSSRSTKIAGLPMPSAIVTAGSGSNVRPNDEAAYSAGAANQYSMPSKASRFLKDASPLNETPIGCIDHPRMVLTALRARQQLAAAVTRLEGESRLANRIATAIRTDATTTLMLIEQRRRQLAQMISTSLSYDGKDSNSSSVPSTLQHSLKLVPSNRPIGSPSTNLASPYVPKGPLRSTTTSTPRMLGSGGGGQSSIESSPQLSAVSLATSRQSDTLATFPLPFPSSLYTGDRSSAARSLMHSSNAGQPVTQSFTYPPSVPPPGLFQGYPMAHSTSAPAAYGLLNTLDADTIVSMRHFPGVTAMANPWMIMGGTGIASYHLSALAPLGLQLPLQSALSTLPTWLDSVDVATLTASVGSDFTSLPVATLYARLFTLPLAFLPSSPTVRKGVLHTLTTAVNSATVAVKEFKAHLPTPSVLIQKITAPAYGIDTFSSAAPSVPLAYAPPPLLDSSLPIAPIFLAYTSALTTHFNETLATTSQSSLNQSSQLNDPNVRAELRVRGLSHSVLTDSFAALSVASLRAAAYPRLYGIELAGNDENFGLVPSSVNAGGKVKVRKLSPDTLIYQGSGVNLTTYEGSYLPTPFSDISVKEGSTIPLAHTTVSKHAIPKIKKQPSSSSYARHHNIRQEMMNATSSSEHTASTVLPVLENLHASQLSPPTLEQHLASLALERCMLECVSEQLILENLMLTSRLTDFLAALLVPPGEEPILSPAHTSYSTELWGESPVTAPSAMIDNRIARLAYLRRIGGSEPLAATLLAIPVPVFTLFGSIPSSLPPPGVDFYAILPTPQVASAKSITGSGGGAFASTWASGHGAIGGSSITSGSSLAAVGGIQADACKWDHYKPIYDHLASLYSRLRNHFQTHTKPNLIQALEELDALLLHVNEDKRSNLNPIRAPYPGMPLSLSTPQPQSSPRRSITTSSPISSSTLISLTPQQTIDTTVKIVPAPMTHLALMAQYPPEPNVVLSAGPVSVSECSSVLLASSSLGSLSRTCLSRIQLQAIDGLLIQYTTFIFTNVIDSLSRRLRVEESTTSDESVLALFPPLQRFVDTISQHQYSLEDIRATFNQPSNNLRQSKVSAPFVGSTSDLLAKKIQRVKLGLPLSSESSSDDEGFDNDGTKISETGIWPENPSSMTDVTKRIKQPKLYHHGFNKPLYKLHFPDDVQYVAIGYPELQRALRRLARSALHASDSFSCVIAERALNEHTGVNRTLKQMERLASALDSDAVTLVRSVDITRGLVALDSRPSLVLRLENARQATAAASYVLKSCYYAWRIALEQHAISVSRRISRQIRASQVALVIDTNQVQNNLALSTYLLLQKFVSGARSAFTSAEHDELKAGDVTEAESAITQVPIKGLPGTTQPNTRVLALGICEPDGDGSEASGNTSLSDPLPSAGDGLLLQLVVSAPFARPSLPSVVDATSGAHHVKFTGSDQNGQLPTQTPTSSLVSLSSSSTGNSKLSDESRNLAIPNPHALPNTSIAKTIKDIKSDAIVRALRTLLIMGKATDRLMLEDANYYLDRSYEGEWETKLRTSSDPALVALFSDSEHLTAEAFVRAESIFQGEISALSISTNRHKGHLGSKMARNMKRLLAKINMHWHKLACGNHMNELRCSTSFHLPPVQVVLARIVVERHAALSALSRVIDFQHALAHATQARHQLLQWRATLRHRVPELKKQSQYWRVAEKTLPNLDKVKALIQLAESINSLGRSLAASCSNDDPGPCTNDIASALNHLKQRAQDAGLDEVVLLDTLHDPAISSMLRLDGKQAFEVLRQIDKSSVVTITATASNEYITEAVKELYALSEQEQYIRRALDKERKDLEDLTSELQQRRGQRLASISLSHQIVQARLGYGNTEKGKTVPSISSRGSTTLLSQRELLSYIAMASTDASGSSSTPTNVSSAMTACLTSSLQSTQNHKISSNADTRAMPSTSRRDDLVRAQTRRITEEVNRQVTSQKHIVEMEQEVDHLEREHNHLLQLLIEARRQHLYSASTSLVGELNSSIAMTTDNIKYMSSMPNRAKEILELDQAIQSILTSSESQPQQQLKSERTSADYSRRFEARKELLLQLRTLTTTNQPIAPMASIETNPKSNVNFSVHTSEARSHPSSSASMVSRSSVTDQIYEVPRSPPSTALLLTSSLTPHATSYGAVIDIEDINQSSSTNLTRLSRPFTEPIKTLRNIPASRTTVRQQQQQSTNPAFSGARHQTKLRKTVNLGISGLKSSQ